MDKNNYLIDLSESEHTDFGRVAFLDQSFEQKVFSAIWTLESQVNNGGFGQFFDNEDPLIVSFATTALRTVGAATCAEIVSRAVALAPDRELDQVAEQPNSLDSQFYQYPDNLTELLYTYVAANPASFGTPSGGA